MASPCSSGIVLDLSPFTSASAAGAEGTDHDLQCCVDEQEELLLPADTCDDCNKGASYEEAFQGPHKWRRQLRHVPSKRSKKNPQSEDSSSDRQDSRYRRRFDSESDNQNDEE